jgi:DNA-binding transcriptional regulator YiaG
MKSKQRTQHRHAKAPASVTHFAIQNENPVPVQDITNRFGVRQDMLSRMTGFSPRAVADWARGKEPSAPAKRVFAELDRLLDALARLMKPKEVGQWLKQPNPAFEGSTPVQVIERGQMDRIWRMLYYAESGEPG